MQMTAESTDMTAYWFRPKRYGYGATPVTWQGWALTLGSVAVVVVATTLLATVGSQNLLLWLFLVAVIIATVVVMVNVSRARTEGEWRWRWGDR